MSQYFEGIFRFKEDLSELNKEEFYGELVKTNKLFRSLCNRSLSLMSHMIGGDFKPTIEELDNERTTLDLVRETVSDYANKVENEIAKRFNINEEERVGIKKKVYEETKF